VIAADQESAALGANRATNDNMLSLSCEFLKPAQAHNGVALPGEQVADAPQVRLVDDKDASPKVF
jgi:hypothetical protein